MIGQHRVHGTEPSIAHMSVTEAPSSARRAEMARWTATSPGQGSPSSTSVCARTSDAKKLTDRAATSDSKSAIWLLQGLATSCSCCRAACSWLRIVLSRRMASTGISRRFPQDCLSLRAQQASPLPATQPEGSARRACKALHGMPLYASNVGHASPAAVRTERVISSFTTLPGRVFEVARR